VSSKEAHGSHEREGRELVCTQKTTGKAGGEEGERKTYAEKPGGGENKVEKTRSM